MHTMITLRFPCFSHESSQSSLRDDTALGRNIRPSTVSTLKANKITG
jgi:hypothetical protein